jgi:hypothetical protein
MNIDALPTSVNNILQAFSGVATIFNILAGYISHFN